MLFINESPWHSLQHKSETLQWRVLWRGVRFTFHFLLVILIRGRRYSPQTPSCVQQHVFFRGPSVPRCKCVHLYYLKNLRHIYTYIYFFFFCLIISRGKGAEQISIWGGGSGSWKRFTIREQIWYPSGSQDPERQCCQGKKLKCCFICRPDFQFHIAAQTFFLILSRLLTFSLNCFRSHHPPSRH